MWVVLDLSIVIVTWNSAGEILACLDSIYEQAGELDLEVLLVDNASEDDTVALVRAHHPAVLLTVNEENHGFAFGSNRGMERARGRNVLLLNPDTVVRAGALAGLVGYLDSHPSVGAVGPKLVLPDGSPQRSCAPYVSLWTSVVGLFFGGGYVPGDMQHPSPVQALSGAALMVTRAVIDRAGMLDTDYFMYGEDTDWCYRIHQAGCQVHYFPAAEVLHLSGQSARRVPVETYVRRRMSRLLFVKKHRSQGEFWLLARLYRAHIWFRWLGAGGERRRYYHDVLMAYDQKLADIGRKASDAAA